MNQSTPPPPEGFDLSFLDRLDEIPEDQLPEIPDALLPPPLPEELREEQAGGDGSRPTYELFTRKPVAYLPVLLDGAPIGYLWGSVNGDAAGFLRLSQAVDGAFYAPMVWSRRLADSHARGLAPLDAIRSWIGAPASPAGGAIPAGTAESYADSPVEMQRAVDPGAPVLEGPLVQDGEFPDGTPVDRSRGWGPLPMVVPPSYPEAPADADAPVRYLTAVLDDLHLGYVWASADATGFVARADAGHPGEFAEGRWLLRLRELFEQGVPADQTLERLVDLPADPEAGVALPEAGQAPNLRALVGWAGQYQQSMPFARAPHPDDLEARQRPPLADAERDAVLRYLQWAPPIHDDGFGPDEFGRERPLRVPNVYRTDGTWVWTEAIAYHLQHHRISPEPALLEHLRANGYQLPQVSENDISRGVLVLSLYGVLQPPPS